uniref:Uncharacterized protein n=1 Tax=Arundo donax TaxID=35708 RepID=A0A0A8YXJ0_ARUDO
MDLNGPPIANAAPAPQVEPIQEEQPLVNDDNAMNLDLPEELLIGPQQSPHNPKAPQISIQLSLSSGTSSEGVVAQDQPDPLFDLNVPVPGILQVQNPDVQEPASMQLMQLMNQLINEQAHNLAPMIVDPLPFVPPDNMVVERGNDFAGDNSHTTQVQQQCRSS